jgi:phosphate transport system protein
MAIQQTPNGAPEHIVHSYDEELKALSATILRMGGIAESQIASSLLAVARRDGELAERVVQNDAQIDELADRVDQLCTRLLALRQPMAVDLRGIVAGIKLAAEIRPSRRRRACRASDSWSSAC